MPFKSADHMAQIADLVLSKLESTNEAPMEPALVSMIGCAACVARESSVHKVLRTSRAFIPYRELRFTCDNVLLPSVTVTVVAVRRLRSAVAWRQHSPHSTSASQAPPHYLCRCYYPRRFLVERNPSESPLNAITPLETFPPSPASYLHACRSMRKHA